MLIYPKELCGIEVLFGEMAAGLLYAQERQINFEVPQEAAMEGIAPLQVVHQGRRSVVVKVRLGIEAATLSLEQPAHIGGPVWIHIRGAVFPVVRRCAISGGSPPGRFRLSRSGSTAQRHAAPANSDAVG